MRIATFVLSLISACVLVALLGAGISKKESQLSDEMTLTFKAIDPDRTYSFADEVLPKDNFDVLERLEREMLVQTYLQSTTILNLKNAARFFPVIEPILAANQIPDDFKYLAVAESNLIVTGASGAGAKGIWQIMPPTAKALGLIVKDEVDERLHLEKSTQAACDLLNKYKMRFGSWTLAAAAYNLGETKFSEEMGNQRAVSFFDMNLNQETARYVFKIIALKEVLSQPEHFGYFLEKTQLYSPLCCTRRINVDTTIANLGDFAIANGTTYRMLKVYNPWMTRSNLPNSERRNFEVLLP